MTEALQRSSCRGFPTRRGRRLLATGACALAAFGAAPSAHAELTRPVGVSASLGYSYPGQAGLGLTGGGYARIWMFAAHVSLDVTAIGAEPNDRYRSETFSNGRTVCRDLTNGQFAKDYNCGGTFDSLVAGMAELHLSPESAPFFVGAGVRTSPAPGPYLTLGYLDASLATFQFWFIRAALGQNFVQLHVGLSP